MIQRVIYISGQHSKLPRTKIIHVHHLDLKSTQKKKKRELIKIGHHDP